MPFLLDPFSQPPGCENTFRFVNVKIKNRKLFRQIFPIMQKSYKRTGFSDGRQSAGVGARDRSAGKLSLKKLPKTVRHGLPFPFEHPILVASF